MRDPNSLFHYGVIGMRWGKRKPTMPTKHYARKVARAKANGDTEKESKYKKLYDDSKAHDARMKEYVMAKSKASVVLETMLMGGFGSWKYNSLRADGVAKGKAVMDALATQTLANLTSGISGYIDKANYKKKN